MKLSVNIPNPLNNRALVYLDGVLVESCIEADEEGGYVVVYSQKSELITLTKRGVVKIVDPLAGEQS